MCVLKENRFPFLLIRSGHQYLSKRDKYSFLISKAPVLFNLPTNEYVVNKPDNMMNGSVYKLAALPMTVHGLPKNCVEKLFISKQCISRN